MASIKFELKDGDRNIAADISLENDSIESYLIAFKAFLIACSFTETLVEEIQFVEDILSTYHEKEQEY